MRTAAAGELCFFCRIEFFPWAQTELRAVPSSENMRRQQLSGAASAAASRHTSGTLLAVGISSHYSYIFLKKQVLAHQPVRLFTGGPHRRECASYQNPDASGCTLQARVLVGRITACLLNCLRLNLYYNWQEPAAKDEVGRYAV